MAEFNSDLNVVPTQTVGQSPVIVDTSSLAVAKLAEAFTGQFFAEKAQAKKRVLGEVASFIQRTGASANMKGGPSLSQAKLKVNTFLASTLANNPQLTAEIGKVASSNLSTSGLSAGKSQAVLRQEQEVAVKEELIRQGKISPLATEEDIVELVPALQKQNAAETELKRLAVQFETEQKNKKAINANTLDLMKTEVRKIAVGEHERVSLIVKRLNEVTGDDVGSRKEAEGQLDALEAEIRGKVSGTAGSLFNQTEIDGMLSGVLSPINALRKRINENRSAKWANDQLTTMKATNDVDFYRDDDLGKVATLVRNLGPSAVAIFSINKASQKFIGEYLNGKGGKGTEGVTPDTKKAIQSTVKELSVKKDLDEQGKEDLANLVEGTLKDLVTDNAQGRVTSPKDLTQAIDILADPNLNKKVASGEIVLNPETVARGERVIQETFLSKLLPSIRKQMALPIKTIEGKPLGSLVDVKFENGVLTIDLTEEAKKTRSLRESVMAFSYKSSSGLNKKHIRDEEAALKDLRSLVASINKVAVAKATLDGTSKTEGIIKPLVESLLGGEVETPKKDNRTEALINTLSPEAAERFNSLSTEQQTLISSMSPDEIRNIVSTFAPQ